MPNIATNSKSWFPESSPSTGAPSNLNRMTKLMTLGTFGALIGAGTAGSDNLPTLLQSRASESSYIAAMRLPVTDALPRQSSAETIDRIRTVLHLNMSALAKLLGVSRQTLYNWHNGEAISGEHSAKLEELATAADLLTYAGISVTGILLKRKFTDGKTLLDAMVSGGSATESVKAIIAVLQREQQQRTLLGTRYAGRRGTISADADLPAPNDD